MGRDGSWQPSARKFPSILDDLIVRSGLAARFSHSRFFGRFDRTWASVMEPAEVDWVPGAYSIIRTDVLAAAGPFDPRFFFYCEEVDLCKRIKQIGYSVCYWPDISVIHIGGESSRQMRSVEMSKVGGQLTLWRMRIRFFTIGNTPALLLPLSQCFWKFSGTGSGFSDCALALTRIAAPLQSRKCG